MTGTYAAQRAMQLETALGLLRQRKMRAAGSEKSGNYGHAGRPGHVGGSAPSEGGTPEQQAEVDQWYIGHAQPIATRIANAMGFDPSIVHFVGKTPPKFIVGTDQYEEGGHFDPKTGEIEINIRGISGNRFRMAENPEFTDRDRKAVEEITTHELMHAVYDAAKKAREEESKTENVLFKTPSREPGSRSKSKWDDLFYVSGEVKPGMEAEVRRIFPIQSIWADAGGGVGTSFFFPLPGHSPNGASAEEIDAHRNQLQKDDGVSPYSASYWSETALTRGYERAFDETLAEVSRIQITGKRPSDLKTPSRGWSNLAQGLRLWYRSTHPVKNAPVALPKAAAAGPDTPDHVAYFDAEFNYQSTPDGAAWAKAIWDNGKRVFYRIEPVVRAAGSASSGNYGHIGRKGYVGGSGPSHSAKVKAALANYKPFSLAKDQAAAAAEAEIIQLTGGISTRDNDPVDVIVKRGGRTHGLEVKTLLDNTNDKVTVRSDAMARKMEWAQQHHAKLHTIVIDQRDTFGKGQGYSGHRLWYKRGVGSFRLGAMIPVESAEHLRELMR